MRFLKPPEDNSLNHESSLSDEFYALADELEQSWRDLLPKFSEKEWLEIFPEARAILPEKIKEWKAEKRKIQGRVRESLKHVKTLTKNKTIIHFWRTWLKYSDGTEITKINRQIARLHRSLEDQHSPLSNRQLVDRAKKQDILPIAAEYTNLKKVGLTYRGCCPLHPDKTPSFYIYPDTQSFYCFGCNEGGDVITLIKSIRHCSFQEAVSWLISGDSNEIR